jgi:hypothetical protein
VDEVEYGFRINARKRVVMFLQNKNLVLQNYLLPIAMLAIIFSSEVINGRGSNSIKPTLSLKESPNCEAVITVDPAPKMVIYQIPLLLLRLNRQF